MALQKYITKETRQYKGKLVPPGTEVEYDPDKVKIGPSLEPVDAKPSAATKKAATKKAEE